MSPPQSQPKKENTPNKSLKKNKRKKKIGPKQKK